MTPKIARPDQPARSQKGYPLRTRPQTLQERLLHHAQFEALKQRRQAWHDRGLDSDEETVQDEDNDDDSDDPHEAPVPLEARMRTTTVDMFKCVLLFSQGAVESLYDNQMLMTLDVL